MAKVLNFGVIGCGMLARSMHIPNISRLKKAVLHTCCDISDEALAECKDKHGSLHISKDYNEVINNPEVDALCVATIHELRLPIIAAAAKAGKPVYVEKPMAMNVKEVKEIGEVVKSANILFCVGHNRRNSPAMAEAHGIFRGHMETPQGCKWRFDREGKERPELAGDGVAAMSVRINDDWYSWKGWVFDETIEVCRPMLFEMTHFTDLCNWFMAAEPLEVVALENDIWSSGVVIRYKTGEMATILMCSNGTFGYPKELYEMFGNGAAVVVDHMVEVRTVGIEGVEPRITYPMVNDKHPDVGAEGGIYGWLAKKRAACQEAAEKGDSWLQFTAEPNKGHALAIENFIDEINGDGPVVCGFDDAANATLVVFAAIKSAEEGRVVTIDEIWNS